MPRLGWFASRARLARFSVRLFCPGHSILSSITSHACYRRQPSTRAVLRHHRTPCRSKSKRATSNRESAPLLLAGLCILGTALSQDDMVGETHIVLHSRGRHAVQEHNPGIQQREAYSHRRDDRLARRVATMRSPSGFLASRSRMSCSSPASIQVQAISPQSFLCICHSIFQPLQWHEPPPHR